MIFTFLGKCQKCFSTHLMKYFLAFEHLICENVDVFDTMIYFGHLWSLVGKGLTFWLSFVMSNCEVVTFPLVSWVRCGA